MPWETVTGVCREKAVMFADIRNLSSLTYNEIKWGFQTVTDNPAADENMGAT